MVASPAAVPVTAAADGPSFQAVSMLAVSAGSHTPLLLPPGTASPPGARRLSVKGIPCGPTSVRAIHVPACDCMALPVVVWPRMLTGGAQGPEASVPFDCQSSQ